MNICSLRQGATKGGRKRTTMTLWGDCVPIIENCRQSVNNNLQPAFEPFNCFGLC